MRPHACVIALASAVPLIVPFPLRGRGHWTRRTTVRTNRSQSNSHADSNSIVTSQLRCWYTV